MKIIEEDRLHIRDTASKLGLSNKTFLITGATGMIGKNVVMSLTGITKEENIIVLGKDYEEAANVFAGHNFVISSFDLISNLNLKVDYIIHLASPTNSSFLNSCPVETIDFMYFSTKKMLDFAKGHQSKMVYVSSMEVFGQVFDEKKREEHELGLIDLENTRSSYSETKRLCELLCSCYAKEFGIDVMSARLSQTFGAGTSLEDPRIFGYLARCAKNKENIILKTKGESVGNYCYLSDTIEALLYILTKGQKGFVYNVVGDDNRSTIFDMATMVASQIANGSIDVVINVDPNNPYPSPTLLNMSNKRLKALGWTPRYSLIDMYKRMLDSFEE